MSLVYILNSLYGKPIPLIYSQGKCTDVQNNYMSTYAGIIRMYYKYYKKNISSEAMFSGKQGRVSLFFF